MTLLLDKPALFAPAHADARATDWVAGLGGGPTLESLISGAWEGLAAGASAACPVCDASELVPGVDAARCRGCGSELS
jgi:hypothetical protein